MLPITTALWHGLAFEPVRAVPAKSPVAAFTANLSKVTGGAFPVPLDVGGCWPMGTEFIETTTGGSWATGGGALANGVSAHLWA